jgi:predicted flap endonuclease-1-like 5' DNA nuclease
MGFLLIKILFLLGVAAASGGFLAYWWFRRHYEDVTLEYGRSREEAQAWRRGFEERLAARPQVDLEPVNRQVAALQAAVEDLPTPERVDLGPIEARLEALSARVAEIRMPAMPDLGPTTERLTAIEHALFPLQSRLDELTGAVRALRFAQPSADAQFAEAATQGAEQPAVEGGAASTESESPSDPAALRDGGANLLSHPAHGTPDDLTQIRGVAKVLEHTLHKVGVFYFWQIAEWSPEDVKHVESQLEGFHRRIEDDDWVGQASELAAQPSATPRPEEH